MLVAGVWWLMAGDWLVALDGRSWQQPATGHQQPFQSYPVAPTSG